LVHKAHRNRHIFYLAFYFQAITGTTAEESGIRTIAYLVKIPVSSIIIGGFITLVECYAPFMWYGSAVFAIGAGMLYTLKVSSRNSHWIEYQIFAGIDTGAGVQIQFIAVQVMSSTERNAYRQRLCTTTRSWRPSFWRLRRHVWR
jgi:Na+/melibiose symporter-like transporter